MPTTLPEDPLANDPSEAVKQAVNGMNAQIGHTDIVGIRIDNSDGNPASPVLDYSTLLS